MAEIVGQMLGFRPTRITQKQEANFAQREAAEFYTARRHILMTQYYHARKSGDRTVLGDVRNAVARYNSQVPFPEMKLSNKDLSKSYAQRTRNAKRRESGEPTSRMHRRLYQEVAIGYPGAL